MTRTGSLLAQAFPKANGMTAAGYRPDARGQGPLPWTNSEPKPLKTGRYRSQKQRLIHHPGALPISAVFGLRYVHTLMQKWAASGTCGCWRPEVGTRPVEW